MVRHQALASSNPERVTRAAAAEEKSFKSTRVMLEKKDRSKAAEDEAVKRTLEQQGIKLEDENLDETLQKCESIYQALHSSIPQVGSDRCSATELGSMSQIISQQILREACGDAALYLKAYQLVGVNYLMLLKRKNVSGCILADEMGLGKTAQTIAFLGVLKAQENDSGPHLVVVPTSLVKNWARELRKWCPSLRVVEYHGQARFDVWLKLKRARKRAQDGDVGPSQERAESESDNEGSEYAATSTDAESDSEGQSDANSDGDSDFNLGPRKAVAPGRRRRGANSDSDVEEVIAPRTRRKASQSLPAPRPARLKAKSSQPAEANFDVLLVSYSLFERDGEERDRERSFLQKYKWSHLILDEAHAVKSRNTRRSQRLLKVARLCKRRIMLTGTPLQNDLQELQNLLEFVLPDVFKEQDEDDVLDTQDEDKMNERIERMKRLLAPFVLRRLKSEVASQLQSKTHILQKVEMVPDQAAAYQGAVETARQKIQKSASRLGDAEDSPDAEAKFVKAVGGKVVQNIFVHLRKIANHPLLIRRLFDDQKVDALAQKAKSKRIFQGNATLDRIRNELQDLNDFQLHQFAAEHKFPKFTLDAKELMVSAKFAFLQGLLPTLKSENHRPLIFSQWSQTLDLLEWLLSSLGLSYVRLDGSTPANDRLALVDKFNESKSGDKDYVFAFLLTTRAGGQGLNLTGADTVILHDVDFNPQVDRQAEDRCHRLGQARPVTVYRLVTEGTVDEDIYKLAERKLALDAAVMESVNVTSSKAQGSREKSQMGQLLMQLFQGTAAPPTPPAGKLLGSPQGTNTTSPLPPTASEQRPPSAPSTQKRASRCRTLEAQTPASKRPRRTSLGAKEGAAEEGTNGAGRKARHVPVEESSDEGEHGEGTQGREAESQKRHEGSAGSGGLTTAEDMHEQDDEGEVEVCVQEEGPMEEALGETWGKSPGDSGSTSGEGEGSDKENDKEGVEKLGNSLKPAPVRRLHKRPASPGLRRGAEMRLTRARSGSVQPGDAPDSRTRGA
eukprot:jgi/Botrbrau1/10605/Bobra.0358s0024.1